MRIWDAGSSQQLLLLKGHYLSVISGAFSPDGTRIVSGSDDKTVRIWDAESGQQLLVLKGHEHGVSVAAFSPDGTRIISSSSKTVRITWIGKNKRQLLDRARERLPRTLTNAEKRRFNLDVE